MADRILNNEIDILNIGNVDNDIRDFFARAMISERINTANTATQDYAKDTFFIHNDRKLYKTLTNIEIGDVITPDINAKKYSVAEALEEIFSGGIGGGHTIQNESGTDVIQRSTMQFTGDVEVSDDTENAKTVVNIPKATEITWARWQELSDEQKETGKWDITGVPGADGTINAELLTKLWENPDPSAAFAAQEITLSSDDYDFLIVVMSYTTIILKKGQGSIISCVTSSGGTILGYHRSANFTTDITINITDCLAINPTTQKISNADMVPVAIYGFKSTVTLKINAIAMDVSTSASKCILEDGRSVEEAIMKEAVVWENPNPYVEQSAQEVTMIFPENKTYEDVDHYEVLFNIVGREGYKTCIKGYTIGNDGWITGRYPNAYGAATSPIMAIERRDVTFNNNVASIQNALEIRTDTGTKTYNIILPVYRIIAHFK